MEDLLMSYKKENTIMEVELPYEHFMILKDLRTCDFLRNYKSNSLRLNVSRLPRHYLEKYTDKQQWLMFKSYDRFIEETIAKHIGTSLFECFKILDFSIIGVTIKIKVEVTYYVT